MPPKTGPCVLEQRGRELTELLPRVDRLLARNGQVGEVRMEKGRVVVLPLEAEERPASVDAPRRDRDVTSAPDRLARPPHRSGSVDRLQPALSAISMAMNPAVRLPARPSMPPSCRKAATLASLAWPRWPTSQPTVSPGAPPGTCGRTPSKRPPTPLVNFHHRLPLRQRWGGGTLSSSDGQRIPVAGKIRNATALRATFGIKG